jgi:hypothetical protein
MNSNGVSCPASVISFKLEKPQTFIYSYVVGGATYQHFGLLSRFPSIQLGSKLNVHYRPDQPEISYAGSTAKELENVTIFAVLSSIFLPLFVCLTLPTHLRSK